MLTVFSASLDGSEAVRYYHVSLVTFYLRQARAHALSAAATPSVDEQFKEALLSVIFASLCLEAFANEMAENTLPQSELTDFLNSRRTYRKPDNLASITWKIMIVFEKQWSSKLLPDSPLLGDVEELINLRNALVHYKIGDSAAKAYLPPPASRADEATGQVMTIIDLTQRPTRVEQPLVNRVNRTAARDAYNTALRVLKLWNQKADAPTDALSAHEEIVDS